MKLITPNQYIKPERKSVLLWKILGAMLTRNPPQNKTRRDSE